MFFKFVCSDYLLVARKIKVRKIFVGQFEWKLPPHTLL